MNGLTFGIRVIKIEVHQEIGHTNTNLLLKQGGLNDAVLFRTILSGL
jgi:hypothetical protein